LLNGRLQEENEKGQGATVNGVTYAWIGIDGQNGKIVLSPCFFFSSDVKLIDSGVIKAFTPVPLVQTYSNK
jgi:hypothetical protein